MYFFQKISSTSYVTNSSCFTLCFCLKSLFVSLCRSDDSPLSMSKAMLLLRKLGEGQSLGKPGPAAPGSYLDNAQRAARGEPTRSGRPPRDEKGNERKSPRLKRLGFNGKQNWIFPIKMGMKLIKPSGNDGNLGFYPAKMES